MELQIDMECPQGGKSISIDAETIAIQKLSRFRNYHGSESIAIQKLARQQ